MERQLADPTFTDALMLDYGSPKMAQFFAQMDAVIPWAGLAAAIGDVYDDSDPARGGRPHWPLAMMVKCLLLQKWFGLSDPGLEEMLRDRLSFRRFVGLSLDDATPDETTFVKFRARLVERGHGSTLFDAVKRVLEERGILLNRGTLAGRRQRAARQLRTPEPGDGRAGGPAHARPRRLCHPPVRSDALRLQGSHRRRPAGPGEGLPL
jgi:transposase, IS5 family